MNTERRSRELRRNVEGRTKEDAGYCLLRRNYLATTTSTRHSTQKDFCTSEKFTKKSSQAILRWSFGTFASKKWNFEVPLNSSECSLTVLRVASECSVRLRNCGRSGRRDAGRTDGNPHHLKPHKRVAIDIKPEVGMQELMD